MNKKFFKTGEHMVWLTATALTVILSITLALMLVVILNGLATFWPAGLTQFQLKGGGSLMGEITQREEALKEQGARWQIKIGNRDLYGLDFRWLDDKQVESHRLPTEAVTLERLENGNFYGFIKKVQAEGLGINPALPAWEALNEAMREVARHKQSLAPIQAEMNRVSKEMAGLQLRIQKARFKGIEKSLPKVARLEDELEAKRGAFNRLNDEVGRLSHTLESHTVLMVTADGQEKSVAVAHIVRAYQPNTLDVAQKTSLYLSKLWELLSAEPRESNTEGGLLPALFGTAFMVIIMSMVAIPLGVVAAVYLSEYAKEGIWVRLVRVAVYNLAGVPSIVYGVFGLGFFIYGVGGTLDQLFFPERLPTPTFGTGGILWASLTLSLLTVPVVIVSTEEAFSAIPKGIREGSLSLGATKFQTLMRILLPSALPGIITGFVMAMARAAGEVAPLMITGVVKLAPALPVDGQFPYVHLDRKFMHLGFHIYDVGFQSPNVEAAKPMVFVTTLLLLVMVVALSITAIILRNNMRKRFMGRTF